MLRIKTRLVIINRYQAPEKKVAKGKEIEGQIHDTTMNNHRTDPRTNQYADRNQWTN